MWLALLCLHLVGLVGFNLILRRSILQKTDRFTLATVAQTGIALPAILLLIIYPPDFHTFSGLDFLYLICAILFTIALQTTNVKALQYLEASVFSVLYNLRIIFTTGLGILFLNEDVVWLRILGGLLILIAILVVKQKGSKSLRLTGIAWGIIAAIVISMLNVFEKLLINSIGFINYFPFVSVVCGILMWSYLLAGKRKFDPGLLRQPKMLQLMTLRAFSAYGFSGSLAAGALISTANYISGMSVIFMVILGAVLLNERDYLTRKIIAAITAVLGLTLVLYASI